MWIINGHVPGLGNIDWQHSEVNWDKEEGVKVILTFSYFMGQYNRSQTIKKVERSLEVNEIPWITTGQKEWVFDLDKLKESFPNLSVMEWFKGKVYLEPEFESKKSNIKTFYDSILSFYITPEDLKGYDILIEPPIEINESLERFKRDYPDPTKVAFIMMQFGKTNAHQEIVKAIRKVLISHGIEGVRADDLWYHDDLFSNVMTYMYGCGMGIAVFERIEEDEFNPNVSLEVGYMFALKKPVCLLKDKTQKTLHSDLVSKLYKSFDPQDPINSIPIEISKWLKDKQIIESL